MLICDEHTWAAAGARIAASSETISVRNLGHAPKATLQLAKILGEEAKEYALLLAVGSGTINDLAKYAAYTANKPYIAIATAASMNGYSSANTSLEVDGHKRSFPARPPELVVADSEVLLDAPKQLTRAGVGDTLCRTTVEADMLLAHHLLGSPYPREIFEKLRVHEAVLLGGLMQAENSSSYTERLMEALLDAGDAMTVFGSSAVASQGEHMIAHTLELKYGADAHRLYHGEIIALTSLSMSQLQHRMLLTVPQVRVMEYGIEQFERHFGKLQAEELFESYRKKVLNEAMVDDINVRLEQHWPEIVDELKRIMISTSTLERAHIHSGNHVTFEQVGIAEERYRFACDYAFMTRERFTFLDLAAMNVKRIG